MDDVQWRFSPGNKVEAKYCPIEIDGDVKYYICPRNEICCTFGCCISSNFHFYQLWYYWLMVILMFLLCSGGTWWYRYWLHEGHCPQSPRRPLPRPRQRPSTTRVMYQANRNTVVVQQIWKPQRTMCYPAPPPPYRAVQQNSSCLADSRRGNVLRNSTNVKPSPYYQLYGPPPSYDSVISEVVAERRVGDSCGESPSVHLHLPVQSDPLAPPPPPPLSASNHLDGSPSTQPSSQLTASTQQPSPV